MVDPFASQMVCLVAFDTDVHLRKVKVDEVPFPFFLMYCCETGLTPQSFKRFHTAFTT